MIHTTEISREVSDAAGRGPEGGRVAVLGGVVFVVMGVVSSFLPGAPPASGIFGLRPCRTSG